MDFPKFTGATLNKAIGDYEESYEFNSEFFSIHSPDFIEGILHSYLREE
jgi:hypothetical protein